VYRVASYLDQNVSLTRMGCGTTLGYTRHSDSRISPLKSGKHCQARCVQIFKTTDVDDTSRTLQTSQIIIKDTISGRKNTSPQNLYETSQLYAAGALKVACVALQCVGFNNTMYRAVLEQATKCALSGKWKGSGSAGGLGTGAVWNASDNGAGDVADGVLSMNLGGRNADGNENIPAEGEGRTKR
jgi:hypothetical protein